MRAQSPSAPAPAPVDRYGRRPSPNCGVSRRPYALPTEPAAPLVKSIVPQALPALDYPAYASAWWRRRRCRTGTVAPPRRCGRGRAPAAGRRRVLHTAPRRCHCGRRPAARRSPRAGTGAASRGFARSPTARRYAVCPSSRRRRRDVRRAACPAPRSTGLRRLTGRSPRGGRDPTTATPALLGTRGPRCPPAARTAATRAPRRASPRCTGSRRSGARSPGVAPAMDGGGRTRRQSSRLSLLPCHRCR